MSPELETLDQLLGGHLPLCRIRDLFADSEQFVRAINAMLESGEIRLFEAGEGVPRWKWREVLLSNAANVHVAITEVGVKRIA